MEIIMRITKTLVALAVVALLLNGCGRSKNLAEGKGDNTTTSPTSTPIPKVK